jgi:intracellular sulfur oxidation DsrE/DsrF family protein
MEENNFTQTTKRRNFLGALATGATAIGLSALVSPLTKLSAQQKKPAAGKGSGTTAIHPADAWFNKVKGRHRVVYDATQPHEIFPFAWPKVFLLTNEATGSPASDCGVVVVLRHSAIGYALKDEMWSKYNLAEVFHAKEHGPAFQAADAATATKTRNPFWNTKPGDFKIPGIGAVDLGIKDLQKSGVMFCVCDAAITVYGNAVAGGMNMKGDDVVKEWKANLIPGIQVVPSGVWALGRAQEKKCAYIFAG